MDNLVPLSALQHYAFCPRQCAYIHIEKIWQDNYLSAHGKQLHERVHHGEPEQRKNVRTERGVAVSSERLGIFGQLDLLEIYTRPFALVPVEYKRGKPKVTDCDRIQLCAQVLSLEEMRGVKIGRAALWYWQPRKREWVDIDRSLRHKTIETISATRALLTQSKLPKAVYTKSCKSCSLFEICQPKKSDNSTNYVKQLFQV